MSVSGRAFVANSRTPQEIYAARVPKQVEQLLFEVRKVIVGQDRLLERVLVALLSGGHILVEGVPGLAKTATVRAFAAAIGGKFGRIQFTPDLVPSDLVGTRVFNPRTADFSTELGPIFCNLLLADEVNRAPAKVQSALLECMQEKQVTLGNQTFQLKEPFMVLATQNPIEQEGTYPLPEAQMDRFLMKIVMHYPNRKEEREIMSRMTSGDGVTSDLASGHAITIKKVLLPQRLDRMRQITSQIYVDERIKTYILDIVFATRNPEDYHLDLRKLIRFGASPRASIGILSAA